MTLNRSSLIVVLVLTLLTGVCSVVNGNTTAQDPPPQGPPANTDPIEQLQLTPDQRLKIRAIREETKDERAVVNRRLREANFALEQALDADSPDEALIEQRIREAGAAQAASMRMRILTEMKIRRVLTFEQLRTLRMLRLQARGLIRDRQLNREANRPADLRRNQRNGIAPLFPRRNVPAQNPRP